MVYAADAVQMAAQHLCDGAEIFEQQMDGLLDDLDRLETDVDVVGQVTTQCCLCSCWPAVITSALKQCTLMQRRLAAEQHSKSRSLRVMLAPLPSFGRHQLVRNPQQQ